MELKNEITEYIESFPLPVQKILSQLRKLILNKAKGAEEVIKYKIPTYVLNGNLVHFAAYKNHIGFYPAPSALEKFQNELQGYKNSKGAVQFPLDAEIPWDLIGRMVEFRVAENTRIRQKSVKNLKSDSGDEFLQNLSSPARNALEAAGIYSVAKLALYSEKEILSLHGVGKASLPAFKEALKSAGLTFQPQEKEKKGVQKKSSGVDDFMQNLNHPLKSLIQNLRKIIRVSHSEIEEEIKWNAPAFYYTGKIQNTDPKVYQKYIAVFNFQKKDQIRIIFISGGLIQDTTGLFEGDFKDNRRMMVFKTQRELTKAEPDIRSVIQKIIQAIKA